jgi:short-subunit dehydrogenase
MKTILITGASDGIGKSIATKLSEQKANLILFGRDEAKLQAVKTACEANGSTVETYAFDLTDNTNRRMIVDEIMARQKIDVLVNNAGIWHKVGDVTTLSEEKVIETINTNLTSQVLLTRQLLDQMRGHEGTAIINIVSKSGITAQAGQAAYTASKYGMKGFVDVLREDTKAEPVRISGVYQSGTRTDMFAKAGDNFEVEKFTNPDDLADVIVFMLTRPEKIWLNEVHVAY